MELTINNVIEYFKKYNIDLENDNILNIKGVKIPNFYKNYKGKIVDIKWEFCHLLFKIYKSYLENDYSFYENKFYKITEKDIVFDCGANMGLFSAYAAAQGATVYAFEPMTYTRVFLKEVQKLYPNNIIIMPYGISNINKIEYFYQCDNPGASHNGLIDINNFNKKLYKEKVNCVFLDSLNIEPTFLKIDVEGAESELLAGAINILKNNKPILSLSLYHKNEDKNILPSLIKIINENYKLNYFNGGEGVYLLCK